MPGLLKLPHLKASSSMLGTSIPACWDMLQDVAKYRKNNERAKLSTQLIHSQIGDPKGTRSSWLSVRTPSRKRNKHRTSGAAHMAVRCTLSGVLDASPLCLAGETWAGTTLVSVFFHRCHFPQIVVRKHVIQAKDSQSLNKSRPSHPESSRPKRCTPFVGPELAKACSIEIESKYCLCNMFDMH